MKTKYYTIFIILTGLLTSQVIAMIQIYFSNKKILLSMKNIAEMGYLIVPGTNIFQLLESIHAAFCGGLFFTFSLGAGICILSLILIFYYFSLDGESLELFSNKNNIIISFVSNKITKKNIFLSFAIILWLLILYITNSNGFNLSTLYFLFVPLSMIISSKIFLRVPINNIFFNPINILPLILVFFICLVFKPDISFINVRDYLLLSNSRFELLSDFYYKYTLFPSEVFKPMELKLLKTFSFMPDNPDAIEGIIEKKIIKRLIEFDYIPVKKDDLIIRINNNKLIFYYYKNKILETKIKDFLKNTNICLKKISTQADPHVFFRHATFLSLIFGMPLVLYLFIYAFLFFCLEFLFFNILKINISNTLLSILVSFYLFCFALLLISNFPKEDDRIYEKTDNKEKHIKNILNNDMNSLSAKIRIKALKKIIKNNYEISHFKAYKNIIKNKNTAEKYWLVRALGKSNNPLTYNEIHQFLDDKSQIVNCQAFYALGKRKNKKDISKIIKSIQESNKWYVQLYAYKALKRLGWTQNLYYRVKKKE